MSEYSISSPGQALTAEYLPSGTAAEVGAVPRTYPSGRVGAERG